MNDQDLTRFAAFVSWIFQLLAAAVLLQNVYFKFIGSDEWMFLFETIGMEPWGRYASAGVELLAGFLLLIPRKAWLGALTGLFALSAAIFFHLTTLGIEVMGDGGSLFYLAAIVFVSCVIVLILRRVQMKKDIRDWFPQTAPDAADENQ